MLNEDQSLLEQKIQHAIGIKQDIKMKIPGEIG